MKQNKQRGRTGQNPAASQGSRPEIRDNLDHRDNLEQEIKGEHRTHNKKDKQNDSRRKSDRRSGRP